MRASGTERPLLGGWLVNDTICNEDSPAAAARIVSSSDRSMRSNTASIDDVTRFSPWRQVENNGFFAIIGPLHASRDGVIVPHAGSLAIVAEDHRACASGRLMDGTTDVPAT